MARSDQRTPKENFPIYMITAVFMALLVLTSGCSNQASEVTDFGSCAAAGNPIMESYPRQCRTEDGKLYVEQLSDKPGDGSDPDNLSSYRCDEGAVCDMVGSDSDEHGCIASAGYIWCDAKQKCLREWEEPCLVAGMPKLSDEARVRNMALDHVMASEGYMQSNGRGLKILSVEPEKCPSCFRVFAEYYLDSTKIAGGLDKATVEMHINGLKPYDLTLDNAISDETTAIAGIELMTSGTCSADGGRQQENIDWFGCQAGESIIGQVETISPSQDFPQDLRLNLCCKADDGSNEGAACQDDSDCITPMRYLILSSCPYGSACVDSECRVVCPIFQFSQDQWEQGQDAPACSTDSDCDCGGYLTGIDTCRCHNNGCMIVKG